MADTERYLFGLTLSDWVFLAGPDGVPVLQGEAIVETWTDRDSDTQYSDLTADKAGTIPIDTVVTSGGGSGYQLGDVTGFYGPAGLKYMWVSANGGPRKIMFCSELAAIVDGLLSGGLVQAVGDLLVGTGAGVLDRLPVGADGQVLTADSARPAGVRWKESAAGETHLFGYVGTVSAPASGGFPIHNDSGNDLVLKSARYSLGSATTTGTSSIDIKINGVSLFTDPADRPKVPAGASPATSGRVTAHVAGVVWPAGTALTVDIVGVGDGTGINPVAQINTF